MIPFFFSSIFCHYFEVLLFISVQVKPQDETLTTKPPVQAVKLRFLQKSKSTDSMTLKSPSESNKIHPRPSGTNKAADEEGDNRFDQAKEEKDRKDGAADEDRDESDEEEEDDDEITDPEAVFEVLEEVLEGVLEGDNVTSLVYSKAQKVKFRDEESQEDEENDGQFYGGIIINDDKPLGTRYYLEDGTEVDSDEEGEKEKEETDSSDEEKKDEERDEDVKEQEIKEQIKDHETKDEETKDDDTIDTPRSDIQVDQAQEGKKSVVIFIILHTYSCFVQKKTKSLLKFKMSNLTRLNCTLSPKSQSKL